MGWKIYEEGRELIKNELTDVTVCTVVDGVVSLVKMIVNEEDGGDCICARDIITDSRQWIAHVFARLGTTTAKTLYNRESNPSAVRVCRNEEQDQAP